jgi:hypothetical protein
MVLAREEQKKPVMQATMNNDPQYEGLPQTVGSVEMWAAAKFTARECATLSKDYTLCRKQNDRTTDVTPCRDLGKAVMSCHAGV